MPDGWEETIEDMPEEFVKALWNLGRRWNSMMDTLDRLQEENAKLKALLEKERT